MNFFFWPTPSKIGQFELKWPINWPSGIPVMQGRSKAMAREAVAQGAKLKERKKKNQKETLKLSA